MLDTLVEIYMAALLIDWCVSWHGMVVEALQGAVLDHLQASGGVQTEDAAFVLPVCWCHDDCNRLLQHCLRQNVTLWPFPAEQIFVCGVTCVKGPA